MRMLSYPVPDLPQTGARIAQLLRERGLTPRMVQAWLGLESPRAIYKWLNGRCLPTVDHLLALSRLMEVPMEALLVWRDLPAEDVASRDVPGKLFCCFGFIIHAAGPGVKVPAVPGAGIFPSGGT